MGNHCIKYGQLDVENSYNGTYVYMHLLYSAKWLRGKTLANLVNPQQCANV